MPKTHIYKTNSTIKQVVVLDAIRKKAKKNYMAGMKYKDICEKYEHFKILGQKT